MAFCRKTKFKGEFEGKPIEAELSPLTLEALLSIQSASTQEDAVQRIAEILPKAVFFTRAPEDEGGLPVPIEDVSANAYFASLIGDLGKALIAAAKPVNPNTPVVASGGLRRAKDSGLTSLEPSVE